MAGVSLIALRGATDSLAANVLGRSTSADETHLPEGFLRGQRVVVTGAGGSIGSELSQQLQQSGASALYYLERDESALHALKLLIDGRSMMDTADLVLADIRDRERIDEVFAQIRPNVVFHAAALKHLPILERNPGEAIKTNVLGSLNLLMAAVEHGCTRFVNISTDKAANPISVLGLTKRLSERLTSTIGGELSYCSVRFGNVLGSRGSLIEVFLAQIEAGGPVTVTSPTVERYFMTVQEAVHLVLYASSLQHSNSCYVLETGAQIRVADVAQHLIDRAGGGAKVEFTGLRPGEKESEDLLGSGEVPSATSHPSIRSVQVPTIDIGAARELLLLGTREALEQANRL